ncbi:MAG TPA: pyridoxamine 5'-phosphate oxidase [Chthoniobacterales bacterium]|nr:pyridoxamine 5'-phosphate oxidase [Chthoniobacterales bacterium]
MGRNVDANFCIENCAGSKPHTLALAEDATNQVEIFPSPALPHERLPVKLRRVDVSALRQEYSSGKLHRSDLDPDPFRQFAAWFTTARECPAIVEPNAMTLATAGVDGAVSARTVLLKDFDATGFRFFTNYESDKARDIAANPQVALLFHWPPFERQISIRGVAEKISREESEAYFQKRPLASRLGALASHQSQPLASREELEARYAELEEKHADGDVPLPSNWGGYLVRPAAFEFWQGRRSRLHDRFRYISSAQGLWTIERLSP